MTAVKVRAIRAYHCERSSSQMACRHIDRALCLACRACAHLPALCIFKQRRPPPRAFKPAPCAHRLKGRNGGDRHAADAGAERDASGVAYLNGHFAGELDGERPLFRPVAPQGPVYLEYRPLGGALRDMARKLVFSSGAPMAESAAAAEDLRVVAWPAA